MLIDFRKLFPRYNIKPKGVLHLGANIGEEAAVYDQLGIKKVLWFEANPEIFDRLVSNIAIYPGQIAYNFCVGSVHNMPMKLHIANNGGQSSSVLELGTHKTQHPDVKFTHDIDVVTKRIDMLFEGNFDPDIDFLSLDLQGFEGEALKGMGDLLRQFKWIYSEVNKAQVYEKCIHVNDLDLFLNGFGFKRVETANWIGDWTDAIFIRKDCMSW